MCLKYPLYLLYIIGCIWLACLQEFGLLVGFLIFSVFIGEPLLIAGCKLTNRALLPESASYSAHSAIHSVVVYGYMASLYGLIFYYLNPDVRYPAILLTCALGVQIALNTYFEARNLAFAAHPGVWGGVTEQVDTLPDSVKSLMHIATLLIFIAPASTIILMIVNFIIS